MNSLISNKIKYLYFFLTIGIVVYHARWIDYFNIKYLNLLDNKVLALYFKFADHIGTVCMVFFFFMSAFWFYKGLNSNKDIFKKWKKRIQTLLIPYLLWTVIIGAYQVYRSEINITFNNIFYHLFESPIAGPLWYILGLLILQFLAPILIRFKKNKKITTLMFAIIIVYFLLRNFEVVPQFLSFENWWWYNNLLYYLPTYLLGAYIGMYYSDYLLVKEYKDNIHTIIGIALIVISLLFWEFIGNEGRLIYSCIELIGIWLVLRPNLFKHHIPKFLACDFYLYALHNPILIPKTKHLIIKFIGNNSLGGVEVILIKVVQVLVIVFSACMCKFIICKFFPKIINQSLTGNR